MIEIKGKSDVNVPEKPSDSKEQKTLSEIADLPKQLGENEALNDLPDEIGEEKENRSKIEPNSKFIEDGKVHETDDSGKVFKVDGMLLPNTTFEVNSYKYKTDESGRIVAVEGTLKSDTGNRDLNAQRKAGDEDRRPGDQGGHLIADRFGGPGGVENLVAMKAELNQGDYKKMENDLAKAVADGKTVTVEIEVKYHDDSKRPAVIIVTYTMDGEKTKRVFNNG